MKTKTIGFLAIAFLLASGTRGYALGWTLVNAKIRSEFPDVKRITTAELAAWLNDPKRPRPLLLDVRTRAEFNVSHLERARHVAPNASASAIPFNRDQPVVVYCSVGYRSARFAKRLIDAGFADVTNLEGSIFRWANEGRLIVSDGSASNKVHPYNRTWGLLLKKELRAEVPPADRTQ